MSTEWLKQYSIPVPPLPTQERIVSELDCINSIIEKKREQLKELDALAQSIFYHMFGDPVTNEKGWEVKKLGEVAPAKEYKGEVPNIDGKYWLLNLDMVIAHSGEIIEQCYFEPSEIGNSTIVFNTDNVLYSKLRPYLNKVVVPNDIGFATSELVPLLPNKDCLDRVYLAQALRSSSFVEYISAKVAGAKMPRVSMNDFRGFLIPIPPLSLQQSFATKIEAIEKQKELIKRSIAETETLLASRMQHYFG
jgi:type I restriction enzyme S subunit